MTVANERMEAVNDALRARDPRWTYRFLSKDTLDAMDRWLVIAKHPLAYQAGTQESRFFALVKEGWQF